MLSTYPSTMTYPSNAAFDPYQPQQQQQQQQQPSSTAIVPAINPTTTAGYYYGNYQIASSPPSNTNYNIATSTTTGTNDLIDMSGGGSGTGSSSYSYSQQSNNTDLIGGLDDTTMSFATTKQTTPLFPSNNTKELEARDEAFVKSLPPELIEEQKRIMAQIQTRNEAEAYSNNRNQSSNNNSQSNNYSYGQSLVPYDSNNNNTLSPLDDITTTTGPLPEEVHPAKYQMKKERKVKTAVGATTGAVIGGVIFGPAWPVGAVAGAAVGGYATKVVARHGERKQQQKWDKQNFNTYTSKGLAGVQSDNVAFA